MELRAKDRRIIGASIGVMVLLAIVAALWWGLGRDRRESAQRQSSAQPPAGGARGADSGPAARPLPKGAFRDIHKELEVRARAGDAQAAYRLSEIIGRCLEYKPMSGGAFTEMLARAIAPSDDQSDSDVRIGGLGFDDPAVLDTMLYAKDRADAICGEVGALPASVRKGDARAWLELAAERGHAKAMVEYGTFAFEEFASDADLLDHAAEVAARRERARGYLRRAFESGEPSSLAALAVAHGPRPYMGRDVTEALAYWKAYRRTDEGRKLPDGVVKLAETQWLGLASPQQQRDSQRRSVEIGQAFQQHRAPR